MHLRPGLIHTPYLDMGREISGKGKGSEREETEKRSDEDGEGLVRLRGRLLCAAGRWTPVNAVAFTLSSHVTGSAEIGLNDLLPFRAENQLQLYRCPSTQWRIKNGTSNRTVLETISSKRRSY